MTRTPVDVVKELLDHTTNPGVIRHVVANDAWTRTSIGPQALPKALARDDRARTGAPITRTIGRALGRAGLSVVLAVTLATPGCATTGRQDVRGTEDLLVAAGFKQQPGGTSGTSGEPAGPGTVPPLSVVPQVRNGQLSYTYADPYSCKCVYMGTSQNYRTYTELRADAVRGTAGPRWNNDAVMDRNLMDRDVWAPWLSQ